ncbi:MAG: universal stress protein [Phycisphaerae bacterium]|jgi:nucleotide-binding universal stress UspA family protein
MIERLLIPLDGSEMSEAVLPAALELAQRSSAGVQLLHVLEQHAPQSVHGQRHLRDAPEAEKYLEELARRILPSGVDVHWHVHAEPVKNLAASLVAHIREYRPDLVVMCSHGAVRLRDRLLGNMAQQVLGHRLAPVWLMRGSGKGQECFPFQRMLVPLDGQEEHEQCLPLSAELARLSRCQVTLLTVVPTAGSLRNGAAVAGSLMPGAAREALDLQEQRAVEYIRVQAGRLRSEGIDSAGLVVRGDPGQAIVRSAARLGADVIALGTHGKAGSKAFWAGSILPRVIRRSRASLLLVPVRTTP